jgi:hypothetical protein
MRLDLLLILRFRAVRPARIKVLLLYIKIKILAQKKAGDQTPAFVLAGINYWPARNG